MTPRSDALLARLVPLAPTRIVSATAARYIAGETLADALRTAADLSKRGALSTLDILGEAVTDSATADATLQGYLDALEALVEARLDPHISIKPSALGAATDWSACRERVREIVRAALPHSGIVNIDMEDSTTTDGTIGLYESLRGEGLDNIAIVLQARLHRTHDDVTRLAPLAPHVRLCKGIYPESSAVAYTDDREVCESYLDCLDTLLDAGSYVAIATHADTLINPALAALRDRSRTRESYEFQTLLGVREELVTRLVANNHRIRVYVPYGPDWYAYAIRRLQESPQIAGHVARATVRSAVSRVRHPIRKPH